MDAIPGGLVRGGGATIAVGGDMGALHPPEAIRADWRETNHIVEEMMKEKFPIAGAPTAPIVVRIGLIATSAGTVFVKFSRRSLVVGACTTVGREAPWFPDGTGLDDYRSHMKYGPTRTYWNDFVFEGYANHRTEVIYLAGLPDVPESRPHSEVNS